MRSDWTWPERLPNIGAPLDWRTASSWDFAPLDHAAFPAVELAKEVGRARLTYPAVYNAANEEAVLAFHAGRIGFLDIVDTVRDVLEAHTAPAQLTLPALAEAERWARERAQKVIAGRSR